jgi:hypothetical protein
VWKEDSVPFDIIRGASRPLPSFFHLRDTDSRLPTDREPGTSVINDFADFEELSFGQFDFANDGPQPQLPHILDQSTNVENVSTDALLERIDYLQR